MIAPLLLILLVLFGMLSLGHGFKADAEWVGYFTSVTGPNYQYAVAKDNPTELTYGTKTSEYIYGYSDIATLPDNGKSVSVNTGSDKDKNFKLSYKELKVVVSVPANTTYTVTFNTTLKGTFEVSNKKATAKYSCQLVYLGEKSAADTAVKFYPGATPKITVDGSEGNTNVRGYYIDPDKKSTTYTCGGDTTQTEVTCNFVNNTSEKKDITHYFGLWVSCNYGSSYANRGTATFTITPKSFSYTLNFDPNGGTVSTTNKTVTVGGTYGTLPKPTRTGGYTFDGWYTKNGRKVTADSKVYDIESYGNTLYAHWSLTPAEPPVITKLKTDITVTYGYSPADGLSCSGGSYHDLSWEWYECDKNGNNGKLLTDENGKATISIKMPPAGVHYYYCEVIATRQDNGLSARTKSEIVKVTVNKATPDEGNNNNLSASKVDLAVNETLSESILTGGEMRISITGDRLVVPGTFRWADGSTKLTMPEEYGGEYYAVVFIPDDTDNYNTVTLKKKVWVKITCSHGDKWGEWQEDGTRACTACGEKQYGTVSVSLTWGAMTFTYYDGDWNPETHEFEYGEWIPNKTDGNMITVENTGTMPVSVSFTYEQRIVAVSAEFNDATTSVTAPVALPMGDKKQVWLKLSGKPSGTLNNLRLGTVKVTIGGKQS